METIEKIVEVVAKIGDEENKRIRIEAVRDTNGSYKTHAYIHEFLTVQLTYPQSDEDFDRPLTSLGVWVDYPDLPWTHGNSVDDVIGQALAFLHEITY